MSASLSGGVEDIIEGTSGTGTLRRVGRGGGWGA